MVSMLNFTTPNLNYNQKGRKDMKNIVITIGREYGSGGKYIGELVAKKLNIPFYDKAILTKTYEKNGVNYSKLEQFDEVKQNALLKQFDLLNLNHYDDKFSSDVYQTLISETIKEVAENGSCVILGRNSNKILKDKKNTLHFFIFSKDLDYKIKRKMKLENLNYQDALKQLKYVDKQRRKYYESLNKTGLWGNIKEYDYLLDSSILGVDKTAELIIEIYNKYKESNS